MVVSPQFLNAKRSRKPSRGAACGSIPKPAQDLDEQLAPPMWRDTDGPTHEKERKRSARRDRGSIVGAGKNLSNTSPRKEERQCTTSD